MGKVLGIVNRKGGVGKTTTATTLSYLLSKEGCKVALIDFDGQRHTTKLCGVTAPEQLSVTIYDILWTPLRSSMTTSSLTVCRRWGQL